MYVQCANALCTNQVRGNIEHRGKNHSRTGLCHSCWSVVRSTGVPIAGFIPSTAVNSVAQQLLRKVNPTREEVGNAVRFARGTRHRTGDWDDRPAYRMAPIKYGRANVRLPHLLVGRRRSPSPQSLAAAFVQYTLAGEIIGTGELYNRFLAGGTFFSRRGLCVPPGKKHEVLKGDCAYSKWTLGYRDLSILGTHALKAAGRLGIDKQDSDLRAFVVVAYMRGLRAGAFNPPVSVPLYSMPTNYLGDHPHDHQYGPMANVPRRYRKAIRRSSGLVNKAWPSGIDPQSHLIPQVKPEVRPAPQLKLNTDWIFA